VCHGFYLSRPWKGYSDTIKKNQYPGGFSREPDLLRPASHDDILVTDCPGCVMQLKGGLDKRESHVKVLHLVELLKDSLK